jgi:hypothetical protein
MYKKVHTSLLVCIVVCCCTFNFFAITTAHSMLPLARIVLTNQNHAPTGLVHAYTMGTSTLAHYANTYVWAAHTVPYIHNYTDDYDKCTHTHLHYSHVNTRTYIHICICTCTFATSVHRLNIQHTYDETLTPVKVNFTSDQTQTKFYHEALTILRIL